MTWKRTLGIALLSGLSITFGSAATISFVCDPNVSAGTCSALQSTVPALYAGTFNNASASIYIQYGTTGLGESTTGFQNQVSFTDFLSHITATASGDAVDAAAIAALATLDSSVYGNGNVEITSALGTALGFTGMTGTTANGFPCTVGNAGCYNGIITITNDPGTQLYYRNGAQDPNSYDFFTVVEHEVNEVLGASSCVATTGGSLANTCSGTNTPSAADLFRYASAGNLVLVNSTPGAYFSYNGGVTNGAFGAVYNTLSNGNDYADFLTGCPASPRIQDGTACPGFGGLDITNDGGAEINILDALGYNLVASQVPEPGTMLLLGAGLAGLASVKRSRRG